MENKITLSEDHSVMIHGIAKESSQTPEQVTAGFIELGATVLLAARKKTIEGEDSLTALAKLLREMIHTNPEFSKFSETVHKFWNAGAAEQP